MGKTKPPYPPEFKEEAVRLALSSDLSIREIAEDLNVSQQSLRNWVAQAQIDAGEKQGVTSEERAELRRLRRENRVLREERDILKKAAAWFAKETDSTR